MTDVVTGLEGALRSNGIDVEELDRRDDAVDVAYTTAFPGEAVSHGEMGRVCNTFIDRLEADQWDTKRVEATVYRVPGDVLGTWHAEADWFAAVTEYRISEEEFSARVLDTLEHRETPASAEADEERLATGADEE